MLRSVLSIDGGGTKTAGLVADVGGNVRKLTSAQGCNPQDGAGWRNALGAVLDQVHDIDFAVIGMPGFGEIPDHDAQMADDIATKISADHVIINDVELAFRGAFPQGDGVLILAGTGSMAIGGENGALRRSGGWGHWFGDEGSGFWIGQQGLARATAELDGRMPNLGFAAKLTNALAAPNHHFGLLDWAMRDGESRAQIASVARIVDQLALSGDPSACSILDAAADHLAALARSVSPKVQRWSHAGSVFQSTRIFEALIRNLGPVTSPHASALVGGLHHAAELANWPITPDWTDKVAFQANQL